MRSLSTNTLPENSSIQYAFTFIMSFDFSGQHIKEVKQVYFPYLTGEEIENYRRITWLVKII